MAGDSLVTVPVGTVGQMDALIAARAISFGHHRGWGSLIAEALEAVGLPERVDAVAILGQQWGHVEFAPLEPVTTQARDRAQEIVALTLEWAEAQDPPLCSLVERVLYALGLGAFVAVLPWRSSLLRRPFPG